MIQISGNHLVMRNQVVQLSVSLTEIEETLTETTCLVQANMLILHEPCLTSAVRITDDNKETWECLDITLEDIVDIAAIWQPDPNSSYIVEFAGSEVAVQPQNRGFVLSGRSLLIFDRQGIYCLDCLKLTTSNTSEF